MSRATHILLLAIVALFAAARSAVAIEADTFSPVVSYQYLDWIGDENVTFQSSPNVSYFFSGGVSLAVSGTVRTAPGCAPVSGATITLKRYGTAFWTGTSAASGAFAASNLQAANYTVTVTKPGFTTLVASYGGETGGNQVFDLWRRQHRLRPRCRNESDTARHRCSSARACESRGPECAEADALRWRGAFHHVARRTRSEPHDGGADSRLAERRQCVGAAAGAADSATSCVAATRRTSWCGIGMCRPTRFRHRQTVRWNKESNSAKHCGNRLSAQVTASTCTSSATATARL